MQHYSRGQETVVPGHDSHDIPERLLLILVEMSYDKLVLVPVEDWLHPG
jgi:hypothetical protein